MEFGFNMVDANKTSRYHLDQTAKVLFARCPSPIRIRYDSSRTVRNMDRERLAVAGHLRQIDIAR